MGKGLKRTISVVEHAGAAPKRVKTQAKAKGKGAMTKFVKSDRFGQKVVNRPEVKIIDTIVNVSPSSTGAVLLLNGCTQGTDVSNRIGRKIEMVSVNAKLKYWNTSARLAAMTNAPTAAAKIDLVYDKQSDGSAPLWSDIWTTSGSITAPQGHRNINNVDRFVVLKSWYVGIDSANNFQTLFDGYVSMNHDVRFNAGNAGTIADITSGGLFMTYADDNAVGADDAILNGNIRVSYRDE